MKWLNKHKVRSILLITMWIVLGCGTLLLLISAAVHTNERQCAGIHVRITGVNHNFFIDQQDVERIISVNTGNRYTGKAINNFDLRAIETVLKKEVWIKDAELYFDNNNVLEAEIEEREPVVRIFSTNGTSYYIDSSMMMLPLSEKFSAKLPVITNFPTDVKVLSRKDSALLRNVKDLGMYIGQDAFLMSMIDQVDITPQRTFELIPKMGNQLIIFGDASRLEEKFDKLKLFYKNIITKTGWGKYSQINLQYDNEVVAKIRGKDDVSADSLRTIMLMQMIAETTERMASDSVKMFLPENEKNTDSTLVMQSLQRDESGEPNAAMPAVILSAAPLNGNNLPAKPTLTAAKPTVKPVVKTVTRATVKPVVKTVPKPAVKKTAAKKTAVTKPKMIMPKKISN